MTQSRSKTALRISLLVSLLSLAAKAAGFYVTDSTTALSDAAESVVHILAVAFVYYGFLLSSKPADEDHLYGHERVEFLSVGVEGLVVSLAGFTIIYQSISHYLLGHTVQNIDLGIAFLVGAGAVNYLLGRYLLKVGREDNNMMVVSNAKHTLTDVWTSAGAVFTLVIIRFTGWQVLDSLVGGALGIYILYEGFKLLRYAVDGLMDARNPEADRIIREIISEDLPGEMTGVHNLRHRTTGQTTWIELHAVFASGVDLEKAHEDATRLEKRLINALQGDVIVTIHLEPAGQHEEMHKTLADAEQDRPLRDFI